MKKNLISGGEQSSGSFGIPSSIFRFGKLENTLERETKEKEKLREIILGIAEHKTDTDKKTKNGCKPVQNMFVLLDILICPLLQNLSGKELIKNVQVSLCCISFISSDSVKNRVYILNRVEPNQLCNTEEKTQCYLRLNFLDC